MSTVALAVTDGMLHFELSVAYEVFDAAPVGVAGPWYDVAVCGSDAVRVGRFRLEPDHGLDRLRRADTVIVPAWADVDEDPPADLVDAVRAAHEAGARVASLCTGAFVLAAAGLLDGRRATTHWAHTDVLAARYPEVEVDPDVLYVDNGSVLTSAGKAAALDLCLHLVRLDHGSAVANAVARRLVVPPHRAGGQAQFVAAPVPARDDHPLADLLPWAVGPPRPAADRGGPGPPGTHELPQPGPPLQSGNRHHPAAVAARPNASAAPRNCWRPPTTASTPSPQPPEWAPPPPCAATSTARSASPRTPTAARSARAPDPSQHERGPGHRQVPGPSELFKSSR